VGYGDDIYGGGLVTFGGCLLLLYRLVYNMSWSPGANSGRIRAEKV
jgi:hypothetical protein